jgi:hypothetical protein
MADNLMRQATQELNSLMAQALNRTVLLTRLERSAQALREETAKRTALLRLITRR